MIMWWHRLRWNAEAYVMDLMSRRERGRFERHLLGCGNCRTRAARLQEFHEAVPRVVAPLKFRREVFAEWLQQLPDRPESALRRAPWQVFIREDWTGFFRPVLVLATLVLLIWSVPSWQRPPTLGITGGQEFARVTSPSRGEGTQFPSPLMGEGRVRVVTPGSTVTAHGGPVTLALPRVQVVLAPGSTIRLPSSSRAFTHLTLEAGTLTAKVTPGTPWIVHTPVGDVRVKGTEFTVQLKQDISKKGGAKAPEGGKFMQTRNALGLGWPTLLVWVVTGLVEVITPQGTMLLAADEAGTVAPGQAPEKTQETLTLMPKGALSIEPAGTWAWDAQYRLYLNGVLFTGRQTQFFPNGQKQSEGIYRLGRVDGIQIQWYMTGEKAGQQTYRNGKPDGPAVSLHPNGQKESEVTFDEEGNKVGTTAWYPDGRKKLEETYIQRKEKTSAPRIEPAGTWGTDAKGSTTLNGTLFSGVRIEWHPNGQKKSEATYRVGRNDGAITFWKENGQKTGEVYYINGRVIFPGVQFEAGSHGITVTSIAPDAANHTGLQLGDRLLTLEGKPAPQTPAAFVAQVAAYPKGSLIKLTVERAGKPHALLLPGPQ